MNKRLYGILDLDQTHIHVTKKLLFSSPIPTPIPLLTSLQKRNYLISQSTSSYSALYSSSDQKLREFKSMDVLNQPSREKDISRKKKALGVSRGRLEVISNLLKTEKTRRTWNEQASTITYEGAGNLRSKRSKKGFAFPISKFNISHNLAERDIEDDERYNKGIHLPSQTSQKQNKEKGKQKQKVTHLRKIKPLEWKNQNGVLNTIRYSSLLRTINNQKIYQNYSTKLPDISMVKKSEITHGRGVFKRVQFA